MHELKEKYIQFCCDFYNEHAPEDKIWFGRMFDQCQEDYEQQNRCMYRWQFPLKVLKDQEATINDLKSQLNNMEACYIGVKKERDDLNEKEILQDHFYDQAAELKNSKLMINELQKRVDETLTWLTRTDVRAINMAREILRGGDLKNLRGANDINLTR